MQWRQLAKEREGGQEFVKVKVSRAPTHINKAGHDPSQIEGSQQIRLQSSQLHCLNRLPPASRKISITDGDEAAPRHVP